MVDPLITDVVIKIKCCLGTLALNMVVGNQSRRRAGRFAVIQIQRTVPGPRYTVANNTLGAI